MKKKQRLLVSSEFWYLVHDHETGQPRLRRNVRNVGLAASLLADLLMAGHITLQDKWIAPAPPSTSEPADELLQVLLANIRQEDSLHPLQTWLESLADGAYDQIADRLHDQGQVQREGWIHRRWVPQSPANAEGVVVRLKWSLRSGTWADSYNDPVLAALAWATGIDRYVLEGDSLTGPATGLWKPLTKLAEETRDVIGRAVVTHRA